MEELKVLMLEGFSKLSNEINGLKSELQEVKSDVQNLKSELQEVKSNVQNVKESQIRMESKIEQGFGALFDAREAQINTNERTETSLARIESQLDRAGMRALYATSFVDRIRK